jgi:dCMP deaminase
MSERISWPQYAIELAKTAAKRSEDPHIKVGACILGFNNQVLSLGYNGAPAGVNIDWTDRDEK